MEYSKGQQGLQLVHMYIYVYIYICLSMFVLC